MKNHDCIYLFFESKVNESSFLQYSPKCIIKPKCKHYHFNDRPLFFSAFVFQYMDITVMQGWNGTCIRIEPKRYGRHGSVHEYTRYKNK